MSLEFSEAAAPSPKALATFLGRYAVAGGKSIGGDPLIVQAERLIDDSYGVISANNDLLNEIAVLDRGLPQLSEDIISGAVEPPQPKGYTLRTSDRRRTR